MANYQDPYAGQYGRYQHQPQYSEPVAEFNPYPTQPPHQTYEQGAYDNNYGEGYRDEPAQNYPPQRQPTQRSYRGDPTFDPGAAGPGSKEANERSRFEQGEFSPMQPRTVRNLRRYRYDFQGDLWTKGGRGRCVGRFCCCTLMSAVFLFLSIVLTLFLWVRPPSATFGTVATTSNGSGLQLLSNGVTINLGLNVSVNNPNFFNVKFKQITADIIYPINNTAIGNGTSKNIDFPSHSSRNFTFPFTIYYTTAIDPNNAILIDLATKCGILGTKSDITVNYKIKLTPEILFFSISPTVSGTFSFECPLSQSDIDSLLKSVGINSLPGS